MGDTEAESLHSKGRCMSLLAVLLPEVEYVHPVVVMDCGKHYLVSICGRARKL